MTELADIFAEDSDNDATFYGFSDSEITEKVDFIDSIFFFICYFIFTLIFGCMKSYLGMKLTQSDLFHQDVKHEAQLDISPEEQKASTQPPEAPQRFRLRVALRPPSLSQPSTNEEEEERKPKQKKKTRNKRKVKFEDVEKAVFHQSASEEVGSETPDSDGFLVKREENIKANKAMVSDECQLELK